MSITGRAALSATTTRSTPGRIDAVTYLTVYIVLLFALPSHLTVTALGSLGDLSVLWGLAGLAWWSYVRLQQTSPILGGTLTVKFALLSFVGIVLLSYGLAQLSGLPSETGAWADSALLRSLSWAGVALVALDGVRDRDRLMLLMRRLVWAGALMACLGLAQFVTGQALVDTITLPGFNAGPEFATVFDREGFTRAAGTASHPLAYGSLLVMLLPLAVTSGIADRDHTLVIRWAPSAVIAIAALTSMSRSVLIGTAVGLLLVLPAVPRKHRLPTAGIGAGLIVAISFAVPGMFSTLRDMFTGVGNDASTLSRTDSAGPAIEIAMRNPLVGRGFGTFMPTEIILDNQVLLLLIEVGLLGLGAFLLMIGSCLWAGWQVFRRGTTLLERVHGAALAAGIAAAFINLCFYDALAFPTAAGLLFLMIGVTGAALGVSRVHAVVPACRG